MIITITICTGILWLASFLPHINNQHWFFRLFDFAKMQLSILLVAVLALALLTVHEAPNWFWLTQGVSFLVLAKHVYVLRRYTPLYALKHKPPKEPSNREVLSIISVNVYQYNTEYKKLIDLVANYKPTFLLTIESNEDWENAMKSVEADYPHTIKVAQENTYGIHVYSKIPFRDEAVRYHVADDLPSLEFSVKMDGEYVRIFAVHPPPPSPTEEENSKERDGELLCVAKAVKNTSEQVVVVGDFNNVAWAKSSVLFKKTSGLIDPRIGRGFVSTFHAKYWFFRFPIDLFFHSTRIQVHTFKTIEPINSDHLPLYATFSLSEKEERPEEVNTKLNSEEREEVNDLIRAGKEEQGDR